MPEDVKVYIRARREDGAEKTALRLAMDAAKVSVRHLEKATGINHQHINNVALGRGGIERRKADALAEALGLPVGELFAHADGVAPAGA
jgi:transcriptional regulator with XRE-family HTH domain